MIVRPMLEGDVAEADRVHRLAFGTLFQLADPLQFRGDSQVARVRWAVSPELALVAEEGGEIAGVIFGMRWGDVLILGPVAVRPDRWGGGAGRALLDAFVYRNEASLMGLFTLPGSARHVSIYESYGFVAQRLTAVMSRTPTRGQAAAFRQLHDLAEDRRAAAVLSCRRITDAVYPGLDLTREIEAVLRLRLGEALLIEDAGEVRGFAVCHQGPGTEAGSGRVFVKFAAAADERSFIQVLAACDAYASRLGAAELVAGVNMGRSRAYGLLKAGGFRIDKLGAAMLRGDAEGYNRVGDYVIDDWR